MKSLSIKEMIRIDKYWRFANYLTICHMYLKNNLLLERDLLPSDLKGDCSDSWGDNSITNFIIAHFSSFAKRNNMSLIPNFCFNTNALAISNSYIYGKLNCANSYNGLIDAVINNNEINTCSLIDIYNLVDDNKTTIIPYIIHDSIDNEINASIKTSKKSNVVVLPILSIKKSTKNTFTYMSDDEICDYFKSLGYTPYICNSNHRNMYMILEEIGNDLLTSSDILPMIIFHNDQEWTALDLRTIDSSYLCNIDKLYKKTKYLEHWLKGYHVEELFSKDKGIAKDILDIIP